MDGFFEVRTADALRGPVEVFADKRLPFEPEGWLRDLRSCLRLSLGSLKAERNQLLYATYSSADAGRADAENILFYNVGTSCFKGASRFGLLFERRFEAPPRAPSGKARGHYYRYSLMEQAANAEFWESGPAFVAWESALSVLNDPCIVWYEVRSHLIGSAVVGVPFHGPFGLDIELRVKGQPHMNLASLVKPLLDGIISALHSYEGPPPMRVVERLAQRLQSGEEDIFRFLAGKAAAVLGERRLVVARGDGVQWNPADDRCHVCRLRVVTGAHEQAAKVAAFRLARLVE